MDKLPITTEAIGSYLENLTEKGRGSGTIQSYRFTLKQLYEFLPEEKVLSEDLVQEWIGWMEEQGYSVRTINVRRSVLNNFLHYMNRWDLQDHSACYVYEEEQPVLTREEYRRLLQAARRMRRERAYLLIKIFGEMDLRVQELPQLTVEAVRRGSLKIQNGRESRTIRLPRGLRLELLDYISRKSVPQGPVFCKSDGSAMLRSSVWQYIKSVSWEAKVPEKKATPQCLRKMCQNTYRELQENVADLVEKTYQQMLEEEQQTLGWIAEEEEEAVVPIRSRWG